MQLWGLRWKIRQQMLIRFVIEGREGMNATERFAMEDPVRGGFNGRIEEGNDAMERFVIEYWDYIYCVIEYFAIERCSDKMLIVWQNHLSRD